MLSVRHYFFDDDDDLWAEVRCNGRRQWRTVVGCDREHPLYQTVLNSTSGEFSVRKIEEYCREHGIEEQVTKLPHIEDVSKPMRDAWEGADEDYVVYTNLGHYIDDEQFQEDYGMSVAEYKRQLQADIDKYGIDSITETPEDAEFLYQVDWWLCEYFTGPISRGV